MNFSEIVNNKLYFSLSLGLLITTIIYYIDRTQKENESKIKKYLKILLSTSIMFWGGLYIKSNNNLVGGGNTSSNNTLRIDDLNLDDPFN